ncbi:hypothetical protein BaRGS_00022388 [Batillaria attramentaria]|uniref:Uncharacterized protein n=1 Tax=Batillaria attramentaria TaxID=370345 RepID=A0ABD0KH85_9CAEN
MLNVPGSVEQTALIHPQTNLADSGQTAALILQRQPAKYAGLQNNHFLMVAPCSVELTAARLNSLCSAAQNYTTKFSLQSRAVQYCPTKFTFSSIPCSAVLPDKIHFLFSPVQSRTAQQNSLSFQSRAVQYCPTKFTFSSIMCRAGLPDKLHFLFNPVQCRTARQN